MTNIVHNIKGHGFPLLTVKNTFMVVSWIQKYVLKPYMQIVGGWDFQLILYNLEIRATSLHLSESSLA